jgi:hypothetical protein
VDTVHPTRFRQNALSYKGAAWAPSFFDFVLKLARSGRSTLMGVFAHLGLLIVRNRTQRNVVKSVGYDVIIALRAISLEITGFLAHLSHIVGMCDATYIIDITLDNLYYFGYEDLGAIYASFAAGEKWIGLSNNLRL